MQNTNDKTKAITEATPSSLDFKQKGFFALWNKQFVRKFKHDTRQNFATNGIKTDKVFFALSVIAKLARKYNIVDEIQVLLARYPNVALEKMGFPVDWKSIL